MKKLTYCFIGALAVVCAHTQTLTNIVPPWVATVTVIDENDIPIANANVEISYYIKPPSGKGEAGEKIESLTDTNGIFTAGHEDTGSSGLSFRISKTGYYLTTHGHELYQPGQFDDKTVAANRHPNLTLVLKKIGKPIPMYARKVHIEAPKTNKPVGFDLVEGDWVVPDGKGKQSDFVFQADRRWVSRKDFDCTVKLTFSNPGDGLIPVSIPLNQGSELRMSATAPSEGYAPELSKGLSHTPANGWKDNEREGNKEQNYYFRVRTILDEHGNVKSALYGKIYGDFALDPINSKTTWILFTYYLNPEPNSRNVEFNPKQNLFKQLSNMEQVKEP